MGNLTLWDRRFGLLLKSWQVAQMVPGKSARVHQCIVHPTSGRGRWIIVALEASNAADMPVTLIEVWDIEKCSLVETFLMKTAFTSREVVEQSQEVAGVDAEPNPAAAITALVRARQSGGSTGAYTKRTHPTSSNITQDDVLPAPSLTVRAIVVGPEFGGHQSGHRSEANEFSTEFNTRSLGRGFMITGSEDRMIRLWDLGRLERTMIVSGLESEHDKPSYRLALTYLLYI